MNKNCPVIKWLAELNPHVLDEHKEVRNGVLGEDQRLLEEDELQINEDVEDIDDGLMEGVQDDAQPKAVLQRLQQQPQGPLVRWERFLPVRSLEVLLVENDDSTRHVVSALLRNCGYEVTAVENGLQAWKILEDLTTHIDLVLSEVAMPWLSGIDLLSKIMSHKSLQNIPVIMMSSYDSMNIVFKCLSKGASDFLAKPIRKNELKNLWQHVWRKCHSSSHSRSESDAHTKKSTKLKCGEASDNTGSNHEDDIGSIGLNVMDGNDNGSGTQSSWTKRAIEVDSPKPMSLWEQLADHPDGTCAQVIHSRTEAFGNNWVPMITATQCEGQDNELDLEIGVSRIPLQLEDLGAKGLLTNIAITDGQKISEMKPKKDDEKLQKGQVELDSVKPNGDLRNKVADLMGLTTNSTDPQIESVVCDISNCISKVSDMKVKALSDNKETPYLELSLKRLRDVGDTGTSAHDRNILRHSELSAFSRYNSASITNQAPIRNDGSCSPLDNTTEAAKTESVQNSQSDSNGTRSNQASNGSSDNNDMGSTTNNVFAKQVAFSDMPVPKSTVKSLHPSSAFQPVQSGHISPPQPIIQGKTDAAIASMDLSQERHINQEVQVQHHHHYYHHHHHHVHDNMPQKQLANHDDLSLKQITTAAPHCGSSNLLSEPFEGNVGNHSLNGSAAGSNHGSNGQSASTTDINAGGTNMESDNGVAGKGGASGVIGFASRSADDPNRSAQREAALNKFRQKRKERCFEKKVRYQSRKELAEQRPRVRGQFVRQAVHKNKSKDMNCKPDLPLIVHKLSSR